MLSSGRSADSVVTSDTCRWWPTASGVWVAQTESSNCSLLPRRIGWTNEVDVELTIVAAGARKDLQQPDASVLLLERDIQLKTAHVDPSLIRLRYAYADALIAAGREDEGLTWMARVAAEDADQITDAGERMDSSGDSGSLSGG